MASITNNTEFYTKRQVSSFLFDKSDKATTYTIVQDDELLSGKQPVIGIADLSISMTNGLLDAIDSKQNLLPDENCISLKQVTTLETLLGDLAPKASVYTQGQVDGLLSHKNNTIVDGSLAISFTAGLSDALGLRVSTTENIDALALKADKLTTYTKTESNALISDLVNSAPATLDTLKEIATALGNDANLSATLTTAIGTKAATTDVTASLLLKADNLTTYTKDQTDLKISDVVGLAPSTLNTIKKVALAINNDDNFSSTINTAIGYKANLASPTFTGIVNGINATMVGLPNVNNTSDADKPVSTATSTALGYKANLASPTFTGNVGIGTLTPESSLTVGGNMITGITGQKGLHLGLYGGTQAGIVLASPPGNSSYIDFSSVGASAYAPNGSIQVFPGSHMDLMLKSIPFLSGYESHVDFPYSVQIGGGVALTNAMLNVNGLCNIIGTLTVNSINILDLINSGSTISYTKAETDALITAVLPGAAGAAGPQGPIGLQGPTGATGAAGLQGEAGLPGAAGATGANGSVGLRGETGLQGPTGSTGLTGAQGLNGATGTAGANGSTGADGVQGPAGLAGAAGDQGPAGDTGPTGNKGLTGNTGATGGAGPIGVQGPTGAAGVAGANGLQGAVGLQGPVGLTGATGAAGATGTSGTNGVNNMDDNLSYINATLTLPNPYVSSVFPMDIPVFTKGGGGNYTTGTAYPIVNAAGVATNYATMLTLTNNAPTTNDLYMSNLMITGHSGKVLLLKIWVKLGTATNFVLVPNNSTDFTSVAGGKSYSATDGLNTASYTLITHAFTAPTNNRINIHIGSCGSTTPVFPQTAGTVFCYGFQLKVRDLTTVLDGSLNTLGSISSAGNISAPNITTMETNISLKSNLSDIYTRTETDDLISAAKTTMSNFRIVYGTIPQVPDSQIYNYSFNEVVRFVKSFDFKNYYDDVLYRFTPGYTCYVEVSASVVLHLSENNSFNLYVFKDDTYDMGWICTIGVNTNSTTGVQPGYSTGSGSCIVLCPIGSYLSLKTYTGGKLFLGTCTYRVL